MSHSDNFPPAMKVSGKENGEVSVAPSAGSPAGIRRWPLEVAVLIAAFVFLYAPTMSALVSMWWSSDDYGHGFLVPFIALYLTWLKRGQLRRRPVEPSLMIGLPLAAAAGIALIVGNVGGVELLQELSMIAMIAGLVALLLGASYLKVLALPIGYLLFMVKFFEEGSDGFHHPFQVLAADIGVWLLHAFGFAAYQDGVYIHLPRITLEVAAACSGVRFLVSIIAIGIPLAYLTQRTWPRRIGLVAAAVVIAVLANGLRVALIGMWTYHGQADLHGPLHVLYGTFVSWVGFATLFVGAWVLGRGPRAASAPPLGHPFRAETTPLSAGHPPQATSAASRARVRHSLWAAILLLCFSTGGYYYLGAGQPLPLAGGFANLPLVIGSWRGDNVDLRSETLRVANADAEVLRTYRDPQGRAVTLYIAYFNAQSQGKELVGYKTSWTFHRNDRPTAMSVGARTYRVNRAVLRDESGPRPVLFWYDLNGRIVAGRIEAKLWTIWDALARRRTNGAFVVVSAHAANADPEEAFRDERRFLDDAWASIRKTLPSKR